MQILFPRNVNCICCNMPISRENYLSLCRHCYHKMAFVEESCIRCGRSGKGMSMCTQCVDEKYYFDRVYSVLEYNDFIHHQIYAYKYGHRNYMGRYFGQLMKDFIEENEIEYDFVTAVPISSERMKSRGFDQSDLLGEQIDGERFVPLFKRIKSTKFLSGLSRSGRILELEGAFFIDEEAMDKMIGDLYGVSEAKSLRSLGERRSSGNIFFDKSKDQGKEIVASREKKSQQIENRIGHMEEGEKTHETVGIDASGHLGNAKEVDERSSEEKNRSQQEDKIRLLVVDDILTTGSTINELSKLVKKQILNIEITALALCCAKK
ncbi:MAG: hypothetical protein Q4A75_07930 [Peptostreptococcaceae bacterium]|nr:hypothetical protein [Peptostreptococcaceae bacterium]